MTSDTTEDGRLPAWPLEPTQGDPWSPLQRPDNWEQRPAALELFAGVGGFRLGLQAAGWRVDWSNQWEPPAGGRATGPQHASDCYVRQFGAQGHECQDIALAVRDYSAGTRDLPPHRLIVGGFPCQDYSVARTLGQAHGLRGKKGVLWWEIYGLLKRDIERGIRPWLFLENVDRLLKSPATQRGRDFAVMLAALAELDYEAEWRVVNAADYGYPQKRRRVFIIARPSLKGTPSPEQVLKSGVLARTFPCSISSRHDARTECFEVGADAPSLTDTFGVGRSKSSFRNAGVMRDGQVLTIEVDARRRATRTLGSVLDDPAEVPDEFLVPQSQVQAWRDQKGKKDAPRTHAESGTEYYYSEGAMPFPDRIDTPARTIVTGEGGSSPSRFKHIISLGDDGYRRLTPRELERLNGFPDDWTASITSPAQRAFMMGNALVVGLVYEVGRTLLGDLGSET